MSEISKHPFDVEATKDEIDEFMKTTAVPGASAEYLHEWELAHGYRERDELNPSVLHQTDKVAEPAKPQVSAKLPDGTTFTGTSEEVSAKVTEHLIRQAEAARGDVPRNANGTFAEKQPGLLDGADRVTSDLVMKSLLAQGIDPDALRDATAMKSHEKAWAHASKEWLATQTPDSYSPSVEVNAEIQKKLVLLKLTDYPSAANIQKAYDLVCADADRWVALRDAKTPEEIEAIIGKTQRESERRVTRGNV
jgi:hypothetical protein